MFLGGKQWGTHHLCHLREGCFGQAQLGFLLSCFLPDFFCSGAGVRGKTDRFDSRYCKNGGYHRGGTAGLMLCSTSVLDLGDWNPPPSFWLSLSVCRVE